MEQNKHTELCFLTAEKYIKQVALVEYKCLTVSEQPDVLIFNSYNETTLYEIKMSKQDFLRDKKKPFRKQVKIEYYKSGEINNIKIIHTSEGSLGDYRYYVCPSKMLDVNDLPDGWGLIWCDIPHKAFRIIHKSEKFKCNKGLELRLLTNALRRLAEGLTKNILTNAYKEVKN